MPTQTAPAYRRLFARPGALAFTAGNLLARLPVGMAGVSAVVMIAGARGSYALAGAVSATGLVASGLAGPWLARLVDRHGQARVARPATLVAVLGALALLLCVRYDAPDWTLFAAYATWAATPNIGGLSRARWAHLLRDDPGARHTANSFEQAADELCFMLGPALASFLTGALFPEAGTLAGAVLLAAGMLLFTAQRATEPPPSPRTRAPSPLRAPVCGRCWSVSRRPGRCSGRWRSSPWPTPTVRGSVRWPVPCSRSRRRGPARRAWCTGRCRRDRPHGGCGGACPRWPR